MRKSRLTAVTIILALSILAINACSLFGQTRTEFVTPSCDVPPRPADLPKITMDQMLDLPDDVYWELESRERQILDWAFEMEVMLIELCK